MKIELKVESENGSTLIIHPQDYYLAISLKEELHMEIDESDLNHECKYIKDKYFCSGAILKKGTDISCLHAL